MVTAQSYTDAVTNTLLVLMKTKGESVSSLARKSGVNRRAIDDGLYSGRDWKTSHLEAIALALDVPLEAIVNPIRQVERIPA